MEEVAAEVESAFVLLVVVCCVSSAGLEDVHVEVEVGNAAV